MAAEEAEVHLPVPVHALVTAVPVRVREAAADEFEIFLSQGR